MSGTPTGSVSFFDGPTLLGTQQLVGGAASITIGTLPVGSDAITASYNGDSQLAESTSSATDVTVQKDGTSVAITSSSATSPFGQPITFTAKVSPLAPGGGLLTGAVTFMDGTKALATVPLDGGSAIYTISTLPVGSHSITAVYIGDSNFQGNISSVLIESIAGSAPPPRPTPGVHKTSTALTAKPKSATVGHPVTLTVKVSNQSGSGGAPIGSVTFFDGSIVLMTVQMSNGKAVLPPTILHPGTNRIRGIYIPTGSFKASKSGFLVVKVTSGHSKKKAIASAIVER